MKENLHIITSVFHLIYFHIYYKDTICSIHSIFLRNRTIWISIWYSCYFFILQISTKLFIITIRMCHLNNDLHDFYFICKLHILKKDISCFDIFLLYRNYRHLSFFWVSAWSFHKWINNWRINGTKSSIHYITSWTYTKKKRIHQEMNRRHKPRLKLLQRSSVRPL